MLLIKVNPIQVFKFTSLLQKADQLSCLKFYLDTTISLQVSDQSQKARKTETYFTKFWMFKNNADLAIILRRSKTRVILHYDHNQHLWCKTVLNLFSKLTSAIQK